MSIICGAVERLSVVLVNDGNLIIEGEYNQFELPTFGHIDKASADPARILDGGL